MVKVFFKKSVGVNLNIFLAQSILSLSTTYSTQPITLFINKNRYNVLSFLRSLFKC